MIWTTVLVPLRQSRNLTYYNIKCLYGGFGLKRHGPVNFYFTEGAFGDMLTFFFSLSIGTNLQSQNYLVQHQKFWPSSFPNSYGTKIPPCNSRVYTTIEIHIWCLTSFLIFWFVFLSYRHIIIIQLKVQLNDRMDDNTPWLISKSNL